jgi:hypothetical protein
LRLVAAGAPDSGHRPASVFPRLYLAGQRHACFQDGTTLHQTLFQAQPQPAGLRFVIWRAFRCIVKPRCIAQEKPVPADKKLDGRKKTSSNRNIRGKPKPA